MSPRSPLQAAAGASRLPANAGRPVRKGASIDVRSADGSTPLREAARRQAWRAASVLLAHGAAPQVMDEGDPTRDTACEVVAIPDRPACATPGWRTCRGAAPRNDGGGGGLRCCPRLPTWGGRNGPERDYAGVKLPI